MSTPQDPFATPPGGATPPAYGSVPGYGPPPAYGTPPVSPYAGWAGPAQTDGRAIAVLVLAICSFVVLPVIPAIVALAMAGGTLRDIEASGGRLTGESLVRAGRIVAWVHLGLVLLGILVVLVVFGLVGYLATSP